jgi:hypothetical protein
MGEPITLAEMQEAFRQMMKMHNDLIKQMQEGGVGGSSGGGDGGKGKGGKDEVEKKKTEKAEGLGGKAFDTFKTFTGGESEWHEWSTDLTVLVATRSMKMREAMKKVKEVAKNTKEVWTCAEVMNDMAKGDEGQEDGGKREELKDVEKMSRELYMWLRLRTEGEAKLVVSSLEEEDGLMAWGKLHAKYSQKTMSRLMRLQQECMYPKMVRVAELGEKILQWEERWTKMEREQLCGRDGKPANIPELWKMAAMLTFCPKEIQDMVELRWDEVGET